ncbi:hypothetical protein [Bifidobacterium callitrichos]|uniref:hypothetical protein n=1 Tax=Bifidobacterium callitrichos TaxID=762209 RepID=UPI001CC2B514|nr:hypothetical protein [Bifidobacterium callitrichos]
MTNANTSAATIATAAIEATTMIHIRFVLDRVVAVGVGAGTGEGEGPDAGAGEACGGAGTG